MTYPHVNILVPIDHLDHELPQGHDIIYDVRDVDRVHKVEHASFWLLDAYVPSVVNLRRDFCEIRIVAGWYAILPRHV